METRFVVYHQRGEDGVHGVFSTREKALEFLDQLYPDEPDGFVEQFIQEFVVDEPNISPGR